MLDDQGTARGQPHLAVKRLVELFVDMLGFEQRQRLGIAIEVLHTISQFWIEGLHIALHFFEQATIIDHDAAIFRVELFTNRAHSKFRLAIQQRRTLRVLRGSLDLLPLLQQTSHVGCEFVLCCMFCCSSHDDTVVRRLDSVKNRAKTTTLRIIKALRDAVGL